MLGHTRIPASMSDIAVTSLNHVTLAVSDVSRSLAFYGELLGCEQRARWDAGAYLSAGDLWLCLSLGVAVPAGDYSHIAFSIDAADTDAWRERLATAGVPLWQDNRSEGASLYCLDPDGHKLELHVGDLGSRLASLQERPYAGLQPLPALRVPFADAGSESLRLLLVAGSVRRASRNRAFVRAVAALAGPQLAFETFDAFDRLPHFSPDEDVMSGSISQAATLTRWLALSKAADAVLFACPEYAGGLPGTFKNGLDHLVGGDAFIDKPFVQYNLAPRASSAQAQLELILSTMSGRPILQAFRTFGPDEPIAQQLESSLLAVAQALGHPLTQVPSSSFRNTLNGSSS